MEFFYFGDPLRKQHFLDAADRVSGHNVLQSLNQPEAPDMLWATYLSTRLKGARAFVPFFRKLESTAATQGLPRLARAAKANMKDELGIRSGKRVPSQAHATWRRVMLNGVKRQWRKQKRQELLDALATPAEGADVYSATLRQLMKDGNPLVLGGAATGLEIIIWKEYSTILASVRRRFTDLLPSELRYIEEHASHDEFHFNALFRVLKEECGVDGSRLDDAMAGLHIIEQTKAASLSAIQSEAQRRIRAILPSQ